MSSRKSADTWFAEYGESHQNPVNELVHWICVPVIFFCVVGFVWSIPVPAEWRTSAPWFNWAIPMMAFTMLFYLRLSLLLSAGMLAWMGVCYCGLAALTLVSPWPAWQVCLALFVAAWVGQFIGHKIEGKKPSFLKDVVFLLVGPAWLMGKVYRAAGQRY
ncbi:MAG: hypothetical protein RIS54_285 [Verrucomicrobiota bacterium]|jgi:uncharacterized membrane protein YGL010W